jgi:hypothetical protein
MRREGYAVPDLVGLVIDPPDMQDSEDPPQTLVASPPSTKMCVVIFKVSGHDDFQYGWFVISIGSEIFSLKLALRNSVGTRGYCMEHLPPKPHKDTEQALVVRK